MEPTPQPSAQPTTPIVTSASSRGVFGTKIPATTAFVVGVLLFFLPFAEIKCRGTVIGKNSGFGIAIGKKWETVSSKSLFDNGNNDEDNKTEENGMNKKQDPNIYAIVAWALGILGLLLSLSNARSAAGAAILTGILSAGALIGLMLDLQKQVKGQAANTPKNSDDIFGLGKLGDMTMKIDFTPWFYIAVIAFLVAAVFSYLRLSSKKI